VKNYKRGPIKERGSIKRSKVAGAVVTITGVGALLRSLLGEQLDSGLASAWKQDSFLIQIHCKNSGS